MVYYGGGAGLEQMSSCASGGSGYINDKFTPFISSFNNVKSATYTGHLTGIPYIATQDPDFSDSTLGIGQSGGNNLQKSAPNGGNGRVTIEFV